MFYSWFLWFLPKSVKLLLLGSKLSTCHLILKICFVRQLVRQLVNSLSGDNNHVLFHLLQREIVLQSEKIYKWFVQDCRETLKDALIWIWDIKKVQFGNNVQTLKFSLPCFPYCRWIWRTTTAEKAFLFGVILVCIFPHSDWYSVWMRENTDQNNSE